MGLARSIMIGLITAAGIATALAGDEIDARTARAKFSMNDADKSYVCATDRVTSCFEQGGQRAVYDLAKRQARYFLFGFASSNDKRFARLKSLGLSPAFAGCVIGREGYQEGYNSVIEIILAPKIGLGRLDFVPEIERPSDL